MADLYNLLDDAQLNPEDDVLSNGNDEQINDNLPASTEWDDDRELVQLPTKQDVVVEDDDKEQLEDEEPDDDKPYYLLKRAWQQEMLSPTLQRAVDVDVSELRRDEPNLQVDDVNLQALLRAVHAMDQERLQYVSSRWLQTRLCKLQKDPLYYYQELEQHELNDLVTAGESVFLKEYTTLLKDHLHTTVLDHLPEKWQKLEGDGMVHPPDETGYVFCFVNEDMTIAGDYRTKGSTLVVRYERVRNLIADGRVSLLM